MMLTPSPYMPNPAEKPELFLESMRQLSTQTSDAVNSRVIGTYSTEPVLTGATYSYNGAQLSIYRVLFSATLPSGGGIISVPASFDTASVFVSISGSANIISGGVFSSAVSIPYSDATDFIAATVTATEVLFDCSAAFGGFTALLTVEYGVTTA